MSDPFERAVEREKSERRGRRRRGVWKRFGIHLRIYLIVNLVLAALWAVEALLDDGHPLWFVHVLWGWGIGLFVHYVIVTQITGQWRPRRKASSNSGVESHRQG
ncbi:MAG: 2TM domain-containing protein [Actinomycetota bacterium]